MTFQSTEAILQKEYDDSSFRVEVDETERLGFGNGFQLRRHKHESTANDSIQMSRSDWKKYIGPIETFADANPYDGNFVALVLPLTRHDRLGISAYFMEYAFLYDDICESANKALAMDPASDGLILDKADSVAGAKQMQSKILLELYKIDEPCGKRIIEKWKLGMSTTRALKTQTRLFQSLEEYVLFRGHDTGAPFVEAIMLFGMGIQLTEDDDAKIQHIVGQAYAALGLANDYFSFDKEHEEYLKSQQDADPSQGPPTMTNGVWLCMQWYSMSAKDAKDCIRKETIRYEQEFISRRDAFLNDSSCTERLRRCLDGLSYMIIGNIVWSLRCPRYHPDLRYDSNAAIENSLLGMARPTIHDVQMACLGKSQESGIAHSTSALPTPIDSPMSRPSSVEQRNGSVCDSQHPALMAAPKHELCAEFVRAPMEWCTNGPSKEVRTTLVDAINIWTRAPVRSVQTIKVIGSQLHNASLLLDDIEDSSSLRRGRPAAHLIFGQAETINSASFAVLEATWTAQQLGDRSLTVFYNQLRQMFIGQSYDIRWTRLRTCPSVEEYISMVDAKTGALFLLLTGLLQSKATNPHAEMAKTDLERFVVLLGRLFQIRDDYKNLVSLEYETQKGFGEDLDEGKFSYPLIIALSSPNRKTRVLESVLASRREGGGLEGVLKHVVLDEMRAAGAMTATKDALELLYKEVQCTLTVVETAFQQENWTLKWLLRNLADW